MGARQRSLLQSPRRSPVPQPCQGHSGAGGRGPCKLSCGSDTCPVLDEVVIGQASHPRFSMKARLLFGCFLLAALQLVGAEAPRAGEEVDLAAFGQARTWDGNPGVEWDEPRV